ncbi:MAG: hypothetical protein R2867_25815 [Caldilineaceae bacterium]
MAAVFLISTGVFQLYAAQRWNIPATEGYSTLLIEYEIIAAQALGNGVTPEDIVVSDLDRANAQSIYEASTTERAVQELHGIGAAQNSELAQLPQDEFVATVARDIALARVLEQAITDTRCELPRYRRALLAIILLLAQGGGYVGGCGGRKCRPWVVYRASLPMIELGSALFGAFPPS